MCNRFTVEVYEFYVAYCHMYALHKCKDDDKLGVADS